MRPKANRGKLETGNMRIAIIVSRWNDFLTSRLADGAIDALKSLGANEEFVEVFQVPGAFELPGASKKIAESGRFDAIVALGVVIRGETPHFDLVAGEAAKGIAQVSLQTGVPVTFGVVTANTVEQAVDRCGLKSGNKGYEAAMAAVEMANLYREIDAANDGSGLKKKAVPNVA